MTQSGGAIGDYSGVGWAPKQGPQNCKCGHGRRPHLVELPTVDEGRTPCLVLGCDCGTYEPTETKD